jgi:hypothetical protein
MDTPDTDTSSESSATAPARSTTAAIEVHAEELQVPAWELAALKAYMKWPIGKVTSDFDFDAALKTLRSERYGY